MSPIAAQKWASQVGFPRVSGDEPRDRLIYGRAYLFSPRERG